MHQPMQGAQAQVAKPIDNYYDAGWNDYINGVPLSPYDWKYLNYKDGWLDCQEATKKYGKQEEI
jgi:hypothetical protein